MVVFLFQNKGLVGNALGMPAGLGSKSPNLQSPPNVSIAKGGVPDQMALGSLPSSISNNTTLQNMPNNGSSPQVMSSIQGKLAVLAIQTYFLQTLLCTQLNVSA